MKCRHCSATNLIDFLDLGFAPPSNAYISKDDLAKPELYYPLRVNVCNQCWLVQTEDYAKASEFFSADYAYFSSTSSSWLRHAKDYTDAIIKKLNLDKNSFVIEVASNDGYLLKNFVETEINCLGIEPTKSTADVAEKLGIRVLREFFGENVGRRLAVSGEQADLIIGNNVYAHVPDINDFTLGLKAALKPEGTITLEFPHLMRLIQNTQFDTIYHEHFSYLSLHTVRKIFGSAGLRVFHVEELSTHGGSVRVFGCHADDPRTETEIVKKLLKDEVEAGLQKQETYSGFQHTADEIKNDLLNFLIEAKRDRKSVIGYGAAAKGNTLLNYAGVKPDLISFICDAAPSKQNKFAPGTHIPIGSPQLLKNLNPDFILILPWNLADEVINNLDNIVPKSTKFVTAIPKVTVY